MGSHDYDISISQSIVEKCGKSLNITPFTINTQSNVIIDENNYLIHSAMTNPFPQDQLHFSEEPLIAPSQIGSPRQTPF